MTASSGCGIVHHSRSWSASKNHTKTPWTGRTSLWRHLPICRTETPDQQEATVQRMWAFIPDPERCSWLIASRGTYAVSAQDYSARPMPEAKSKFLWQLHPMRHLISIRELCTGFNQKCTVGFYPHHKHECAFAHGRLNHSQTWHQRTLRGTAEAPMDGWHPNEYTVGLYRQIEMRARQTIQHTVIVIWTVWKPTIAEVRCWSTGNGEGCTQKMNKICLTALFGKPK